MTKPTGTWRVRLSKAAEGDFQSILRWTAQRFGPRQARIYARTLSNSIEALTTGPTAIGARKRDDVAPSLYSLHVARNSRKGRHFVLFRVARQDENTIDILMILHDIMEISQHLSYEGALDDEG